MTDSRLKGEWLGKIRFDQLSDTGWRVFTSALMWSNEQGTDGLIPRRYLKALHPEGEKPEAFAELEDAGLFVPTDDGYSMPGWGDKQELGQNTAEQVAAYRENAKQRQRKSRASKAVISDSATGDVTRDIARDVGTGIGKGISLETRNDVQPEPFCAEHMPLGPGTASCIGCMNAGRAVKYWEATHPPAWKAPAPQPPRHEVEPMCSIHPGYPDSKISPCEACKRDTLPRIGQPQGICPVCMNASDLMDGTFTHPGCAENREVVAV